jgi:hypothetical protein
MVENMLSNGQEVNIYRSSVCFLFPVPSLLNISSIMNMESEDFSETPANICRTTQLHIPDVFGITGFLDFGHRPVFYEGESVNTSQMEVKQL